MKPTLAYFHAFINLDDIKVEGEGEEQTHELRFHIEDELRISTGFFDPSEVLIEFDGGSISLSRTLFLQLQQQYAEKYEKEIHHQAIDELLHAIKDFPEKVKNRFEHNLNFLRSQLDQRREKKETGKKP
jgi:hypothetical protein